MNRVSTMQAESRKPFPCPIFTDGIKISLHSGGVSVAATGVDLKNSLCMTGEGLAEVSGITGDINDPATYEKVSETLHQVSAVDAVACDLHPDLHSTRLAFQLSERLDVPLIRVQHHHAHIATVMAEHGMNGPAVGLAMDGYGYGTDGSAWGGECLYIDGGECSREGYLKPVAMPGGDAASRQPWRMAVAWLNGNDSLARLFDGLPVATIRRLCESENTPLTSSAGRLFDAASAIVLGSRDVAFEGEAAVALEKAAMGVTEIHPLSYNLEQSSGVLQLDCTEAMNQLMEAVLNNESKPELAAGFHRMLAAGMAEMATRVATLRGVKNIVLAGGCFLNALLKEQVTAHLEDAGLRVFCSQKLPYGDGAIALGQAWVAVQKLKAGDV
ncbi:MAG: carbamoyltransferase HypF [Mariprofundaceae bacterium]|nr:carbamoyltransferase HypF [Mariprofundaceae bacterium]